ncbi:predicted protein [Pyrenophora tritici-repentis Pt-1C-BFP]|uniref:Uncharacterized protein n=1 Tax=Pyrenophora tritici-repentis (strain Pt-1C-BFP) TaxID=426418 RepID=B2WAX8_PYRTR|nr:uncharacterized protein PTRG_07441 [Pyrenophora tritici-repentis Pt-1C-BFP]EDU50360.1 predicted protein [Pyrenophora tritici-repentis Pt-1C-BFP]
MNMAEWPWPCRVGMVTGNRQQMRVICGDAAAYACTCTTSTPDTADEGNAPGEKAEARLILGSRKPACFLTQDASCIIKKNNCPRCPHHHGVKSIVASYDGDGRGGGQWWLFSSPVPARIRALSSSGEAAHAELYKVAGWAYDRCPMYLSPAHRKQVASDTAKTCIGHSGRHSVSLTASGLHLTPMSKQRQRPEALARAQQRVRATAGASDSGCERQRAGATILVIFAEDADGTRTRSMGVSPGRSFPDAKNAMDDPQWGTTAAEHASVGWALWA